MNNWLYAFPGWAKIDLAASIDAFVSYLNTNYNNFFSLIKAFLNSFIHAVYFVLDILPWWLFIVLIILAARKLRGSWKDGCLYGFLLFLIGCFGYWGMMLETLSIVLTAVFFSLLLGFPLGILAATGSVESVIRPVLDAMQTMPTFVYMIPAVMLMGPGKVPAVLATVVYSVVPVIRLTSHGIRQVDKEVVEAARAFGSSAWQTLVKVQIPQAKPTIMTGVNQTMMMAVAMVVTSAMIGANGLGMEVLIAINRTESGRGMIAGLSIVFVAIVIDRLTQGLTRKGR
jgi:ABC-type proline/glycine betaine transport system permease subunit